MKENVEKRYLKKYFYIPVHIIQIIFIFILFNELQFYLSFKCDHFLLTVEHSFDILLIDNPKMMISERFIRKLRNYTNIAPINDKTGHKFLIIIATSSGPHLWYTLNYYCSIRLQIPSNYYLFISLDYKAYDELSKRGAPTILYSDTVPKYEITYLRMHVVYQLLLWNIDVLMTDSDMVYFNNPLPLFNNESDFEVSYEYLIFLHDYKNHDGFYGNLGFWKVIASSRTIKFIKNLLFWCCKVHSHDQAAFHAYLSTQKGNWISDSVFVYNLTDLNMSFSIHYLDNLQITLSNSIYCHQNRKKFTKEALRRKIYMPIIYHVAWYWPTRKASSFYEKNAWFVNFPDSKDCKKVPPNGTLLFWDSKYDLPQSPKFPRKWPPLSFPP